MEMKVPGIFFFLILISLSFSGCVQQEIQSDLLSEVHNNPGMFDSPYYGISFQYPDDWIFSLQEKSFKLDRIRELGIGHAFRAAYTNNTSGFSFVISGSREDFNPHIHSENFSESQECGFAWTDDRLNLTVSEAYNPVTIDGGKARRFIFVIHDPDIETVETYYDICRTYKSGKGTTYRIFWGTPSGRFYDYKPVVQEILDSMRIYEPS